ncbi:MAG: NAD(P)/FAD-dependent oxidoreductase [Eubacterium sp.]|nr:NAD(P)/FAD-dependent oxidoreductase [Eubacterium sp.]
MSKYVIIGNGISSIGCIEGIRSVDKEGSITVIAKEKHMTYARPLISYYLEGKTTLNKMKYRTKSFYTKNNVEVLYDTEVTKIDKKSKKVSFKSKGKRGSRSFEKLCICTGSTPFVPPFKGLDTVENKHCFMTLDDTLGLEKAIDKNSRVLIIGAGLIGLKCAEGIAERVKSITVCDLADRVLSSILDAVPAKIMQNVLEDAGVKFMLSNSVAEFNGNTATMNDGSTVEFDVLVLAVGVKANTSLASDIGCKVNRGILVDEHCMTSVKNIYSAGDCAEGYDLSLGDHRVLAILPNAYFQGECAGKNMAGELFEFTKGIPMNSIGFFGLHSISAGSYFTEKDGCTVYEEKTDSSIKRFFTMDNKLVGYMLVGDTDRAGIFTSLIREETPLDSIDFETLMTTTSLGCFEAGTRAEKLGSRV